VNDETIKWLLIITKIEVALLCGVTAQKEFMDGICLFLHSKSFHEKTSTLTRTLAGL
jgi:hypothetical protein